MSDTYSPYNTAAPGERPSPLTEGIYTLEILSSEVRESSTVHGRTYGLTIFRILWSDCPDPLQGMERSHVGILDNQGHGGPSAFIIEEHRKRFKYLQERIHDRVYARVMMKTTTSGNRFHVYEFRDEPFLSRTAQTYINLHLAVHALAEREGFEALSEDGRTALEQLYQQLDEGQQELVHTSTKAAA